MPPRPPNTPPPFNKFRAGGAPGFSGAQRDAARSSGSSPAEIAEIASSAAIKTLLAYEASKAEGGSNIQFSSEPSALVSLAGQARGPVDPKIVQDALQRAEHAISASLAAHVETAKKLSSERQTIHEALRQLSLITGKPVNNWSLGMVI